LSKKGARGLMQLMPGTADRYGVNDSWDPEQNLDGGARYLRDLLDMFDQDLKLAVAAYNAGENAVKKYGNKIPPYPETVQYVRKVVTFYQTGS
ncbi:MAG: lytic transglycosylase domain-containing protein, partial [Gammaproteobacteria bacterium]|nr:lytic transglycosylase domain-containing protein [Gammaproteobacteria bacterium]